MIMAGRNIKQFNDPLQEVTLSQLYRSIKSPKQINFDLIKQLRVVQSINPKQYRKLKTQLPYITCGIFKPRYRKTENFGSIEYFVLDIDHISEKGLDKESLRKKLEQDDRVCLLFVSPSNDGFKVFFKLKEKCYDAQKYAIFYRAFAKSFSSKYGLEQVLDKKTSDVARACFVSYDPKAYFDADCVAVDVSSFVDFNNLSEVRELEKSFESKPNSSNDLEKKEAMSDDLLEEIKRKLNPNLKSRPVKKVYVPEILEKIVESVAKSVNEYDIMVKHVKNIHYGKQFTFAIDDMRWAEINIFYGRKGFSIVKSTKSGSNEELAEIVKTILTDLFYKLPEHLIRHD